MAPRPVTAATARARCAHARARLDVRRESTSPRPRSPASPWVSNIVQPASELGRAEVGARAAQGVGEGRDRGRVGAGECVAQLAASRTSASARKSTASWPMRSSPAVAPSCSRRVTIAGSSTARSESASTANVDGLGLGV